MCGRNDHVVLVETICPLPYQIGVSRWRMMCKVATWHEHILHFHHHFHTSSLASVQLLIYNNYTLTYRLVWVTSHLSSTNLLSEKNFESQGLCLSYALTCLGMSKLQSRCSWSRGCMHTNLKCRINLLSGQCSVLQMTFKLVSNEGQQKRSSLIITIRMMKDISLLHGDSVR